MEIGTQAKILRQVAEADSFRYLVERRHLLEAAETIERLAAESVGRVLHDLDGKHYVETFDGTYDLPPSVWDAAAAQCKAEGLTDAGDFTVGGRLAKVALRGGKVVGVVFLCNGRRYPETMAISEEA